ncbi:MAG: IS5 family transposase [Saprospiraceae bacterium]
MAKIGTTPVPEKPKDKYRVKNWPAYNAGLKQRGSLTLWLSEDVAKRWHFQGKPQRGGQYEYSDDCIRTLLLLKVACRLAFRQLEGFAVSILALMGVELKVPSYTQASRRQKGLQVSLGISERLKNGERLHIVIDSSGLKIYGECEWKVRKHGYSKRRTWRKIHLAVDEKSGEITAQVLTDKDTDDASVLPDLVVDTFDEELEIGKVGTDGAYDTFECWGLLKDLEIEPVIPPRENAAYLLDPDGCLTDHPRNAAIEIIDQGGEEANRKGWKVQSGYHRRSISENAFFRWKTILGEKMYARNFQTQRTEAAIKSAVLNRFIQVAKPQSVKVA